MTTIQGAVPSLKETSNSVVVNSTTKGFMVPVVTSTEEAAIDPLPGMIVYESTGDIYRQYTSAGGWQTVMLL
jgi:uncharacterized membrane protein